MKKIITIVGARPQFIKAAVVSRALSGQRGFDEAIIHTGQHYDANMSDIFFEQMCLPRPTYNLGIGGGSHGAMTGRQLEKIEEILNVEKPDVVLIYGDTNSTLAGALAAVKLNIPVAHVEAGLRSFNNRMPEEINRIIADRVSTLLFAPTETARSNLLAEGIHASKIHVIGDVMCDAALFYRSKAVKPAWFREAATPQGAYVLCTIHRAENTESSARLQNIFRGLSECGLPVIMPLHPRTVIKVAEFGIIVSENIRVVEPAGYLEMLWLEINASVIATDSGGVQKEAYFQRVPCVTFREETEWVELVDSGWNELASPDSSLRVSSAVLRAVGSTGKDTSLYGDGAAAYRVASLLHEFG